MPFVNPFNDEEMNAAAQVPLTEDLLMHAMRIGTLALASFADDPMKPIVDKALTAPTDRNMAIGMTFYRQLALLRTFTKLTDAHDFQTLGSSTRTAFELCVDVVLLTDNLVSNGVERFHGFTRAARFSAAYQLVEFYKAHPDLNGEAKAPEHHRVVAIPGLREEIELLCKRLWGKHKPPAHWSNLRWSEQAALLPIAMREQYEHFHHLLAWQIHSGGAGVGGLSPSSLRAMETLCRDLIKFVVPMAFRAIGVEFNIPQDHPDFFDRLEFVATKIETLACIDARLQTLGRPPKFDDFTL
jgi:hypothetical protein